MNSGLSPEAAHPDSPPLHRLRWSGLTDRGRIRPNNEDSFLALTFDAHEVRYLGKEGEASLGEGDFVFAVSDGMGGANSGEFASKIAVEKITRLLPRGFRVAAKGMSMGFQDILEALVEGIHAELLRLGSFYAECHGMGATLSLAWFSPGWMYFAHLGDSRIYYLPAEGGMTQITQDDSYVGYLRRTGQINEREARTHPRKNVLQKALGAGHQFVDPQVGAVGLQSGDRFVLCTDGVIDGLWDRALEELVRTPPGEGSDLSPARRLVQTAVRESGRDNTTAIVVEIQ